MRFLRRLLIASAVAILVGVGLSWVAVRALPGFLFEWRLDRALIEAGTEIEQLEVDGQVFEHAVGGDGPAIVFVHGFGGDKRMWTPYVQHLVDDYRLLAPDLPGHGGSSRATDQVYTLESMADALGRFVDAAQLSRFHLVGSSMGGGIALAYALEHPDRVASLTLLNPWGVSTPTASDRERELERGRNVFFPDDREQLDELSRYVYGVALAVDDSLADHLLADARARRPFNELVFEQMHGGPRLNGRLSQLRVPTLVVVGAADRIVHPSSLEVFRADAPTAQLELLPGCAHVFIGPCFDRSLAPMIAFLATAR